MWLLFTIYFAMISRKISRPRYACMPKVQKKYLKVASYVSSCLQVQAYSRVRVPRLQLPKPGFNTPWEHCCARNCKRMWPIIPYSVSLVAYIMGHDWLVSVKKWSQTSKSLVPGLPEPPFPPFLTRVAGQKASFFYSALSAAKPACWIWKLPTLPSSFRQRFF